MSVAKLSYRWTSKLAYVVGLIVTDGCLSNDRRHIILRSTDIEQIRTFKECLGLKNRIGVTRNGLHECYRLQFGNKGFYLWLESIGLSSAKSRTIGPIAIPSTFLRDFVRGHLDGDGNIQIYWDKHNQYRGRRYHALRIYTRFISASERHIQWLREQIIANTGLRGALIKNKPHTKSRTPIWEIKFAKNESLKLYRWLYHAQDIPNLSRKRMLATRAAHLAGKVTRRPYSFID